MAAKTDYWIIAPAGENASSGPLGLGAVVPAGARIVSTAAGSAQDKAFNAALLDNNSPLPEKGWQLITGPFPTEAQAKAFSPASAWQALGGAIGGATSLLIAGKVTTGSVVAGENAGAGLGDWQLSLSGVGAWFARGLKLLFGGILMIVAVLHLTGADNKLTQALPYAALAAA